MSTALPVVPGASLLAGTPAAFRAACDAVLADAKASVATLKARPAEALQRYDDLTTAVGTQAARASLAKEVHPDAAFREVAESCEQQLEAFSVELAQDRGVYDALTAAQGPGLDAATSFWLFKTLREFRRAGVDRDEATRQKVKALNEKLVQLGQDFGRAIRDDVRTLRFPAADLAGVPADWLKAHPTAADGTVAVTTNPTDYLPVLTYARKGHVREALWKTYRQRAPGNGATLDAILSTRAELAALLGYESWAAYALETKMVKTAAAAADFIAKGEKATQARAVADMAVLLKRKQQDEPRATQVEPWDVDYYSDRIQQEQYGFDSQALRAYFEYGQVKKGVMDVTGHIFSVRYVPVKDAAVWHPDVETYDLFEGERLLGRLHLDMHPREGKYKHAAQFGLTVGRADGRIPEAVLVCNFPEAGDLMQHRDVETFFHEFGHLLHELFGGHQRWGGLSGVRTEWDFVEVPSMLLQEWPLDGAVLERFARHHQTGATIPDALVKQMKAAKDFGVGLLERRQFFLAAVSFEYHRRQPPFDTTAVLKELQARFEPFRREWVEGTQFQNTFGHLDGYSAAYYTYLWSTVIAKDLLSRFQKQGMLNPTIATEYRKKVLDPGGSREAAALVQDFLGRDASFDAFQAWVEGRN